MLILANIRKRNNTQIMASIVAARPAAAHSGLASGRNSPPYFNNGNDDHTNHSNNNNNDNTNSNNNDANSNNNNNTNKYMCIYIYIYREREILYIHI